MYDVFIASSLYFFGLFDLSSLCASNLLKQLEHDSMFFFCLLYLLEKELFSFGKEGKFFGVMNGGGHEDVIIARLFSYLVCLMLWAR